MYEEFEVIRCIPENCVWSCFFCWFKVRFVIYLEQGNINELTSRILKQAEKDYVLPNVFNA